MNRALVKTISGYSVITLSVLAIALVFAGCPNPSTPTPDSGTLDTGFLATGAGANGSVYSVAVQSDGKVLIGGYFTTYNGTSRGNVARLNSDGSLDTGFLATGAGANVLVSSVAVQSDGKVLIGGYFTTYNGTSRGYVARLNSDGSLDTGFLATGTGADSYVISVAVQSDGKVLIGGSFGTYNGTSRGNVARLNSDGSLDTGFLATGA
ncbi:MAG: delta-60 repeat domain-containing protein, partial [Spirochaetia bacterium]